MIIIFTPMLIALFLLTIAVINGIKKNKESFPSSTKQRIVMIFLYILVSILDPILYFGLGMLQNIEFTKEAAWKRVELAQKLYLEIISKFELVSTSDIKEIVSNYQVVFEGAQGLLLDERYGTMPYCTHSDTTPNNAIELLHDKCDAEIYGVLRAYSTRHGAGPLPTEKTPYIPEPDNPSNPFQGEFRTGYFDAGQAKRAINLAKVDKVVITCVDLAKKHHMSRIWDYDPLKLVNRYYEIRSQEIMYELENRGIIEEGDLYSNSEEGPLKEVQQWLVA